MVLPGMDSHVHLSAEPKAGRTSMALQYSTIVISEGGRVIWGSEEMPDGERFSQLFADLDISAASRFHMMSTGADFARSLKEIGRAAASLPKTGLVVIDDWTPTTGRVDKERVSAMQNLLDSLPEGCQVMATSSAMQDASGEQDLKTRGRAQLEEMGFHTWMMRRSAQDARRELTTPDEVLGYNLQEDGFRPV